jgi:hypothetical protein
VTLQNNLRGASWSVAPLKSHNISKHIMDVMTLFCIHYFSLVVRLDGTRKYCMQTKAIPLKVCVFLCDCDYVYCSFFSQLFPKQYLMFQLMEMSMLPRTKLRHKGMKVSFWRHISIVFKCLWNMFKYKGSEISV